MKKIVVFTLLLLTIVSIIPYNSMASTTDLINENYYEENSENDYIMIERNLLTQEEKRVDMSSAMNNNVTEIEPSAHSEGIAPYYIVNDELERIMDASELPYSATCHLDIMYENSIKPCYGTAFMVSPNVAVTAAHCTYMKERGEATAIGVVPGSTPHGSPYGTANVVNVIRLESYTGDKDWANDWAVLILDRDIGNQSGWIGMRNIPNHSALANTKITSIGGPEEKNGFLHKAPGTIGWTTDKTVQLKCDILGGMSGGPVVDEENYVVSIIVGEGIESLKWNYGRRINEELIKVVYDIVYNRE